MVAIEAGSFQYCVTLLYGKMGDQACNKLFQGGVAEVYILHVVSEEVWGMPP